jgi:hypothetical protein
MQKSMKHLLRLTTFFASSESHWLYNDLVSD